MAVFIKTLDRDDALRNCLRSVRRRLKEQGLAYRIYVADDGPDSPAKRRMYRELRERGHRVVRFDERVGASRARNALVDRLEGEDTVLRLDDDFELTRETDVAAMRSILERVSEVGVIGDLERQIGLGKGVFSGQISDAQGFFETQDDVMVRRLLPPTAFEFERAGPHRFVRCDFVRNFLLIRREVLREVEWDDRLTFAGEHSDFLFRVGASSWDVAFTPDSVHLHRDDLGETTSGGLFDPPPAGQEAKRRVFREKYGVDGTAVRRTLLGTLRAGVVRGLLMARRTGRACRRWFRR